MADEREMIRHLPFPFEDHRFPNTLGAVVQMTVLSGEQPAREVIHAPDGSWLVGDGVNDPNPPGASIATHIAHAIERNSSIAQLATMPPGHIAQRSGPGDPWRITRPRRLGRVGPRSNSRPPSASPCVFTTGFRRHAAGVAEFATYRRAAARQRTSPEWRLPTGARIISVSSDKDACWFAVRCVFASGWPPDRSTPVYEERITLWLATSAEEAIERAEVEAIEYAGAIEESPDTYLGIAQSYRLADTPGRRRRSDLVDAEQRPRARRIPGRVLRHRHRTAKDR